LEKPCLCISERDENLLNFIKYEAELVLKMTDGYDWNTFSSDEKTQHAVGMALINIGESVKSLSKDLKQKNNSVKWSSIAGLRDVAAHGYQTLHMDDIWKNITENVSLSCWKV